MKASEYEFEQNQFAKKCQFLLFPEIKVPPEAAPHHPHPSNNEVDLTRCAKPLVLLGRLLLLIPCGHGSYQTYKQFKFSLVVIPRICSVALTVWTAIDVLNGFALFNAATSLKQKINASYFFLNNVVVSATYMYFIAKSDLLFEILDKWANSCLEHSNNLRRDHRPFRTKIWLLLGLLMGAALFVQTLYNIDTIMRLDGRGSKLRATRSNHNLEYRFNKTMFVWKAILPFDPYFAGASFILHAVVMVSRILVPSLIVFFARAASYQFISLIEDASASSSSEDEKLNDLAKKDKFFWRSLVLKFGEICHLVREANRFLSPLIFLYVTSLGYSVCIQVFRVLCGGMPRSPFIFWMCLATELAWLFVTIYTTAQTHEDALRILELIEACPKEHYESAEVARLELKISGGHRHIGFTGLSYYTMDKKFLLSVLSAIFTIEIIFLQSTNNNANNNNNNNNNSSAETSSKINGVVAGVVGGGI